jgi:Skp family chaperone for outer membrane proteins
MNMRFMKLKTATLTILLLTFLTAPVFAQTKVGTVDMQKIFNDYWKKKTAQVALDNRKVELRKEIKDLATGLENAQTNYRSLLEQANDQTLSQAEREKKKSEADAKAKSIAESKNSLEQFQRQAESQLADQSQRMSANLVTDIQKAVADQAKAKGCNLVLNTRTEAVIYAGPETDITTEVLKQLNAGAPIDVNQTIPAANTNAPVPATSP